MESKEEIAPDEKGAVPVSENVEKDALDGIDRTILSEHLEHKGVQILVLDRMYKAERRCAILDKSKEESASIHTELAVAKEKLEAVKVHDLLRSVALGVGCLLWGAIPSVDKPSHMILFASAGLALVAISCAPLFRGSNK